MTRIEQVRLLIRERRAATEQYFLGRALRAERTWINRVITWLVLTRVPGFPSEPGRSKRLDGT